MQVRNTADHARDVVVDGDLITVEPGATADIRDDVAKGLDGTWEAVKKTANKGKES